MKLSRPLAGIGALLLGAAALTLGSQPVTAADHADGPALADDGVVDLGDLYVWNTSTDGSGNIVMILTYSGLMAPGEDPVFDADAIYQFHIDTDPEDNDYTDDLTINVRFGQNLLDEWGVQFEDVPGADDAVFNGFVQTELASGDVLATAGQFDDPFFMDLDALLATLDNLTETSDPDDLEYDLDDTNNVDAFAGTNTMAIVIEFPQSALRGVTTFSAWGSSGRAPQ